MTLGKVHAYFTLTSFLVLIGYPSPATKAILFMSVLFISHSSSDNQLAKELEGRLVGQGHHSVFLDLDPEKGIVAGQSWERTLYTKLRACRAVVALCTDSYLSSHWCFAEIALARMEGKHIFTLLADPFSEQTKLPSILTEHQFIDLRTDKEGAYERLWRGFKETGIEGAEARDWNPKDPPYPGLLAFREKDAAIFFGREHEVNEGVELLNSVRRQAHPRIVVTLGASGSGKSSLVRAGLLPRLRRDASQWLMVDPFRPGTEPERELATAFSRAFERTGHAVPGTAIHEQLLEAMAHPKTFKHPEVVSQRTDAPETVEADERNPFVELVLELEVRLPEGADPRLVRYLRLLREVAERPGALLGSEDPRAWRARIGRDDNPILARATELRRCSSRSEASVLLVIDQFEELLGHEAPGHSANRFLMLLRDALEAEESPLLVLGTMRSDFLGSFQQNRELSGIGFKSLSIGPIPIDGMRKVIDEPAKLGAIQLENGLTDLLLDDTGTSDALPLLAFTLRVMWEKYINFDQGDRLLEIREYEDLGRLQGAVAKEADEVLEAALREGKEEELKNAFLRMVRITEEGNFARQPVRWETLPEQVHAMLQRFVDKRLLVSRGDGTLEVAHEALFRSWDRLKSWLDEDREFLLWQQRLGSSVSNWERAGRDEATLLRGAPLVEARGHLVRRHDELTENERAFIEKSVELHEREKQAKEHDRQERELMQKRSNRRLRIFLGVASVLAVVSAVSFFRAQQSAQQARVAQEKTVSEVIKAAWKAGGYISSVFGGREMYTHVKPIMNLEKLQSLSPVDVFRRGPHTNEFDLTSQSEFGYYNREFVVWAKKHLIPGATDVAFRQITQPVYDALIKNMARTYYLTHESLGKKQLWEAEKQQYLEKIEKRTLPDCCYWERYWKWSFGKGLSKYQITSSIGFWIRRSIDGTEHEFFEMLIKLMRTYDAEFLISPPRLKG